MGITSLSGGGLTTAFVTKRDTAGQKYLTVSPVSPSTAIFSVWNQVTAASSADWYFVGMTAQVTTGSSPGPSEGPLLVNLGIGASGSETVVEEVAAPFAASAPAPWVPFAAPLLVSSGLRIAARVSLAAPAGTIYTWRLYFAYVPASSIG